MKWFTTVVCLMVLGVGVFLTPAIVRAQTPAPMTYSSGTVQEVLKEDSVAVDGKEYYIQVLSVKTSDGKVIELQVGSEFQPLSAQQRLRAGMSVVTAQDSSQSSEYVISDVFRLPVLAGLALLFLLCVFVVAGWQGIRSTVGMVLSVLFLVFGVVPALLAGWHPVLVSLVAGACIAGATIYISHGFSAVSHIALASLLSTLAVVAALATFFVKAAVLAGLGSEEAYFLQFGQTGTINLQGLLLGGILLGALGVLDDITVSQVSIVFELAKANLRLSMYDLYERAMVVGRHHVASLVNTLVLAYASANMPLFILFTLEKNTPAWVHINSEVLAEEIIRTLVGSIGLVMAVPIATLLAAWAVQKWPGVLEHSTGHTHAHVHEHADESEPSTVKKTKKSHSR